MASEAVGGDRCAAAETGSTPGAVREELNRILASAEFVASDRLRSLLRFVVEESLAGRAGRLKAYTIAVEAFGRDPTFDAQNDPVVRTEAGKLRRRLERYYLGAGQNDPVRIEIPKGGYAPTFISRSNGLHPHPSTTTAVGWQRLPRRWIGLAGLTLVGAIVLAIVVMRTDSPMVDAEVERTVHQDHGPAIIVLPFDALSEGEADDVFASGLTEELISNLMRFGELRLYSTYGSFLQQPSADLASQLAQPYGIVHDVTADLFRRQRPETLAAYECVLLAFAYRRTFDHGLYRASRACLEQAVLLDGGYADAWALLAFAQLDGYRFGYGPDSTDATALELALSSAQRSVELDSNGVLGLLALSSALFYRREFVEADQVHRRVLALNPVNPEVLAQVGWRTAFAGDWDKGAELLQRAIDRSIQAPHWYHLMIAFDHYRRGAFEAALANLSVMAEWKWAWGPLVLAAVQGQLGNREQARRALQQTMALDPGILRNPRASLELHNVPPALTEHIIEGLRKAGLVVPEPLI